MAISVDKIYKTVLTILNREQRGQLAPGQFNKLAQQAQIELLERAYYDYSRSLNKKNEVGANNDYGNMPKNLKEKIDIFSKDAELLIVGIKSIKPSIDVKSRTGISLPTQVTAGTYSNLATTSNGSGTGLTVTVVATTNTFSTVTTVARGTGYIAGDVITIPQASMTGANSDCTFPIESTDLINSNVDFPTDVYRIINLSRSSRSINFEELTKSEYTYVNSSKLTTPSETYPIYYRDYDGLKINPISLIGENLTMDYVKIPDAPIWNASSTAGPYGSVVIDTAASVDFELHPSEETNLIIRLLSYIGVIIKDPLVIQTVQKQEQTNFQKENI